MSSVVGLNPPRNLTGFGSFGRGDFDAAIPLRISSAIVSLSFLCSCTARIFTARMRSSGRSRVVFIGSQIPRNLVFCQRRRFSSPKKWSIVTALLLISVRPLFASAFARLRRDKPSPNGESLTSFRFWSRHFLDKRFETRIAVQRIEQWIYLDPADVGAVAFLQILFEPTHGFIFIVQAEIKQGAQVADYLTVLTYLIELAQHSPRGILVTRVSFSLSAQHRHIYIVA